MKIETANLLKQHLEDKKFEIKPTDKGLEFNYELSDGEVLEIVEAEYGKSIVQPVPDLFKIIVKDLLKLGIEYAKKDVK